jgi:uncharacterized protein YicC (UPF0701 family)
MTGFGAAEGRVGDLRVTVEVRSVNHRFFTPSVKLPGRARAVEAEAREALRGRVRAGTSRSRRARNARTRRPPSAGSRSTTRLDATWTPTSGSHARSHSTRSRSTSRTSCACRVCGGRGRAAPTGAEGTAAELVAIVHDAVAALTANARCRGRAPGRRAASVWHDGRRVRAIAARAPARLVEQRDRLRAAVRELADGVASTRPARAGDRGARRQARRERGDRPFRRTSRRSARRSTRRAPSRSGKRLGFLLQEMLREVNTTGSKANDAAILADVVLLKEELERIREQVENVE